MAGKMKVECDEVVHHVHGQPDRSRPHRHRNADVAGTRTQDRDHPAEIGPQRIVSSQLDSGRVRCLQATEIMIAVGRVPAHPRTRGRQQTQLRPHLLAGSHHEHGASLQIEKHRQKSHALRSTPVLGSIGIIFYIWLVQYSQRENYSSHIAQQL